MTNTGTETDTKEQEKKMPVVIMTDSEKDEFRRFLDDLRMEQQETA